MKTIIKAREKDQQKNKKMILVMWMQIVITMSQAKMKWLKKAAPP